VVAVLAVAVLAAAVLAAAVLVAAVLAVAVLAVVQTIDDIDVDFFLLHFIFHIFIRIREQLPFKLNITSSILNVPTRSKYIHFNFSRRICLSFSEIIRSFEQIEV
ncbi:hypothetical protein, partial [Metabacillus niabensis]|uniref:hypothetical protein n=1 Tax=Metabacillus niabensis TaxID=324854 RepID=UPI0015816820